MAKKTISAKGVPVDFDLIKIKEQMATSPVSVDVQRRQNFIENRLRRHAKKKLPAELSPESTNDVVVEPEIAAVEEAAPMIEEPVAEKAVVQEEQPAKKSTKKSTKKKTSQKARPSSKDDEAE